MGVFSDGEDGIYDGWRENYFPSSTGPRLLPWRGREEVRCGIEASKVAMVRYCTRTRHLHVGRKEGRKEIGDITADSRPIVHHSCGTGYASLTYRTPQALANLGGQLNH